MIDKMLSRPVTVLMIFLALAGLAGFALTRLPVELAAEIDYPRLSVATVWANASAEMVERRITTAVEQVCTTIGGMQRVSSVSREGQSQVEVEFQKGRDMDLARLELSEKIRSLAPLLPQGARPPELQRYVPREFSGLQGFLTFQLYGSASLMRLQDYAEEFIRPALLGVNGVASVTIQGGAEREIQMTVDAARLQGMGLTPGDIEEALASAQISAPAGGLEAAGRRQALYAGQRLEGYDDLHALTAHRTGQTGDAALRPIPLSELGTLQDTIAAPWSIVRINGKPALTVQVDKEPGINMIRTAKRVEAVIARIATALPPGLALEKIDDKSREIGAEISELTGKALFSALCILLILWLCFRSLLQAGILFLAVIFSAAGGVLFLAASGIGLNILTLAALTLSFGVIVDNAVVILENIQRHFIAEDEADYSTSISAGAREMRLPLLAATLTTVGGLLPVTFLPEQMRGYIVQFAVTTAVVLLFSYLVAMTLIPVALQAWQRSRLASVHARPVRGGRRAHAAGRGPLPGANPAAAAPRNSTIAAPRNIAASLADAFSRTVRWNLAHRKTVLFGSLALLGLPFWALPDRLELHPHPGGPQPAVSAGGRAAPAPADSAWSGQIKANGIRIYNLLLANRVMIRARPWLNHLLGGTSHLFYKYVYKGDLWKYGTETYLMVYLVAPQGTEMARLDDYMRRIESALAPQRRAILRTSTYISGREAMLRVDFDAAQARTAVPLVIKDQLTALVAGTSGFDVSISGYGPGFYSGGGMSVNYTIQVLGYNYLRVREIAAQTAAILQRNARVADLKLDRLPWQAEEYELVGEIDRRALYRCRVELGDFIAALATRIGTGVITRNIDIGAERIPFRLVSAAQGGRSRTAAGDLDIGGLLESTLIVKRARLRCGEVLRIRPQPVMAEIKRENQQYSRYISFEFKGPQKSGDRFVAGVVNSIKTPPGYLVRQPDSWLVFGQQEKIPFLQIAALSILLVFMITASLYESLRKPFIILFSVPMSLTGLFAAFWLFDVNFGRSGYAALIFLVGLSVNNGIILVDRIGLMLRRQRGSAGQVAALIAAATTQRARPILITTLTTIAGFLPFVIKADPFSFWYGFSFAVISGLTASTLLTLLVMPVLYRVLSRDA